MGVPMYLFLVVYVVLSTGLPIYYHYKVYGVVNWMHSALAFFLGLNAIVCLWEMCLFIRIELIHTKWKKYSEDFKGKALQVALQFFTLDVNASNILSPDLWAEVWASYAVFDPSYANKQSFGFYVDVGNGFTTLMPTILFLVGMSKPICNARSLGVIGLLSFYQEFYGTCIYFLSFIVNGRYKTLTVSEVLIFVCFTNGLWFFLPLLGMYVSWRFVETNSYDCIL